MNPISKFFQHKRFEIACAIVFVIVLLILPEHTEYKIIELFKSVLHHLIGVLIFFILFEKTIKNLLVGNKFSESSRFDANEYFSMIKKSNKEIKILETYIELLLKKKGQLRDTLQVFIQNAIRQKNAPAISILLINPFSKFATTRLEQLYPYYQKLPKFKNLSKEKYFEIKRNDMENALREINELKSDIDNYARDRVNLVFDVRVYDAPFFYSIYACDAKGYFGLYHGDKPSVASPQLVAHDMYSDPSNFLLSRFDNVWENNNTISLSTYLNIPKGIKALDIIEKFNQLWETDDIDKIYGILTELSPDKIDEVELYSLVSYLQTKRQILVPKPHYNVFGSGGDKTINISTMSSILASHYKDNIVLKKVGTVAVTSQVGSFNFYSKIHTWLHEHKNDPLLDGLNTNWLEFNTKNKSEYHSVGFFGFEYRNNIKEARIELYDKKILDIFKVIFPTADFTTCDGQINGYSNDRYAMYFKKIFSHFRKTGIIVHSEFNGGTDEICLGKNEVIIYKDGGVIDEFRPTISCPTEEERQECLAFLNEGKEDEHVERFVRLIKGEVCNTIKEIFSWNIATIIKLKYIDDKNKTVGSLKREVYDYYFGHHKN